MKITSKNYNESFRQGNVNGFRYLTWFNYKPELLKQGKSLLTIEDFEVGHYRSVTKIVELPYEGLMSKKERYNFFNKHKDFIEKQTLIFHKN